MVQVVVIKLKRSGLAFQCRTLDGTNGGKVVTGLISVWSFVVSLDKNIAPSSQGRCE